MSRVSTEVTFWHSAEYGSDFRCNSSEIPRNSAEFRGISPELRRNHFRSQKIPRNSVSAEFRGHPTHKGCHCLGSAEERGLVAWEAQHHLPREAGQASLATYDIPFITPYLKRYNCTFYIPEKVQKPWLLSSHPLHGN
jgi:hypothetical protein